ncbi:MAG: type II toxin-antitoxin system VapC family toxin [Promethearchaeia archaeon]
MPHLKKFEKILIGDFHSNDFLDTSSAIKILRGEKLFDEVIEAFDTRNFGITAPSIFELYHGIYKLRFLKKKISKSVYEKLKEDLRNFIDQLNIFPLDGKAANFGAKIYIELKNKGQEINAFDCLIAAIIIINGFKEIITGNKKHFERIEGLKIYSI